MKNTNAETIKMVEKALAVLDLLRTEKEPLGVNEIAKRCELNPSTAFRILTTLEISGWVFQLSDDRYILGQKNGFVTEKNNLYLALRDVGYLVMREYTEKYGRAMNLIIRDGVNCTIIQQSRTGKLIEYIPPLYSNLPFYACGAGKILLCELSTDMITRILNSCEMIPLTPHTITDHERFFEALEKTKENGYSIDDRESAENGSCIAVPIRDNEGTIIASLSFTGFMGVKDTNELLKYLEPLKEAAEKIKNALYCVN